MTEFVLRARLALARWILPRGFAPVAVADLVLATKLLRRGGGGAKSRQALTRLSRAIWKGQQ